VMPARAAPHLAWREWASLRIAVRMASQHSPPQPDRNLITGLLAPLIAAEIDGTGGLMADHPRAPTSRPAQMLGRRGIATVHRHVASITMRWGWLRSKPSSQCLAAPTGTLRVIQSRVCPTRPTSVSLIEACAKW